LEGGGGVAMRRMWGEIGEEEETLYSFFIFIFFGIISLIIIIIICNFTNTYMVFIFIF